MFFNLQRRGGGTFATGRQLLGKLERFADREQSGSPSDHQEEEEEERKKEIKLISTPN